MTNRGKRTVGWPRPSTSLLEPGAYLVLSLGAVVGAYWLCANHPARFVLFLIEDSSGEYSTFVAYSLATVLLGMLAFTAQRRVHTLLFVGLGLATLFLAGEEISWGQRVLGFETPATFREHNRQNELTIHNLAFLQNHQVLMRRALAYFLILWSALSALMRALPRAGVECPQILLLLSIRPPLAPAFLAACYFFLNHDLPRAEELGEILLGLAVVMWTFDLYLTLRSDPATSAAIRLSAMLGLLLVVSLSALLLAHFLGQSDAHKRQALNYEARFNFPHWKMFDQANMVFEYVYSRPRFLRPDTRIYHARMLLDVGQTQAARTVLMDAERQLRDVQGRGAVSGDTARLLGLALLLQGDRSRAADAFERALSYDRRDAYGEGPDSERAERLWSIARTKYARGETSALGEAEHALALAQDGRQRALIRRWLGCAGASGWRMPPRHLCFMQPWSELLNQRAWRE